MTSIFVRISINPAGGSVFIPAFAAGFWIPGGSLPSKFHPSTQFWQPTDMESIQTFPSSTLKGFLIHLPYRHARIVVRLRQKATGLEPCFDARQPVPHEQIPTLHFRVVRA